MEKPKVLLVEDNETYRKAVRLAMDIAGFEVFEAGDGQRALEIARVEKPNVIICDVHMPVMDGVTMLLQIKKDPNLQNIPVIMLTNLQEEIDHAVEIGAEEAILKASLTPHQVIDVCRKYLQPETPVTSTPTPPATPS
jgi:CheY-like chemotaxis protein